MCADAVPPPCQCLLCALHTWLPGLYLILTVASQIMAMVEKRMLARPQRAGEYRNYQAVVPFCVPWRLRSDRDATYGIKQGSTGSKRRQLQ